MTPDDITPRSIVLDIVSAHPDSEAVFRSYDQRAGECVLCNALFETLEELSQKYDLDLQEILTRLRPNITP
ncbi:MAG: hypothetical protein PHO79_08235 [Desulfoplanes sp.]|jgi:thiol-disulfide isomerase/thioredoxin|nr:hypothetical protein [Desulfoplanes sp.]MDD4649981.1 hypothetical protein [Desulfoplanes sp.]